MTTEQAIKIVSEVGDAITSGAMNEPERFGPNLRCASRRDIRKALMLWIAYHRFQGTNTLKKIEISPGNFCALQESADMTWQATRLLGWRVGSKENWEGEEENRTATLFYDSFMEFLYALPRETPDYWARVYQRLFMY